MPSAKAAAKKKAEAKKTAATGGVKKTVKTKKVSKKAEKKKTKQVSVSDFASYTRVTIQNCKIPSKKTFHWILLTCDLSS